MAAQLIYTAMMLIEKKVYGFVLLKVCKQKSLPLKLGSSFFQKCRSTFLKIFGKKVLLHFFPGIEHSPCIIFSYFSGFQSSGKKLKYDHKRDGQ